MPETSRNELLAALPTNVYERLRVAAEEVFLAVGQTIMEPAVELRYVHFPTEGCISLLSVLKTGQSTEFAIVGNEGMIGLQVFMGGKTSMSRAVVQCAGRALRLATPVAQAEYRRCGKFQILVMRSVRALFTQVTRNVVCNRHHAVEQHLCRWLLRCHDRLPTNELAITHEKIAGLLGARRQGVTEAAAKLQRAGLIQYARGRITIVDRAGLEARACECYRAVKNATDQLRGPFLL